VELIQAEVRVGKFPFPENCRVEVKLLLLSLQVKFEAFLDAENPKLVSTS